MSKEQCPADMFCPDYIQDACDTYYQLTQSYPCLHPEDEHFIKLVASQVQQELLEGDAH